MATKKTATKKTAAKKTATKKTAAKKAPVTADVEVAPAYTAWVPTDMPIGGKSNSTEQLNDHPTEHNHTASAVSDIVDRFADLRLYVPGVNSCGIAGDLIVDGVASLRSGFGVTFDVGCYGIAGHAGNPAFSFSLDPTTGMYATAPGRLHFTLAGTDALYLNEYGLYSNRTIHGVDGTSSYPAYSFTSDPKTGFYLYSKGVASIVCDGKNIANFGTDGVAFPEGLATITGTAANIHIGNDGQLRRITDVAKTPTTADIERLETLVEKLSARIEELESSLRPAAKPAVS